MFPNYAVSNGRASAYITDRGSAKCGFLRGKIRGGAAAGYFE